MKNGTAGPGRPLRAVFICQAVDLDDPVLPTTPRWIDALARKPSVGQVTVLARRRGRYNPPDGVDVRSFGRSSKPATLAAFYRELLRAIRPRPDFYFVYQGGPYPVLLLPFKLVRGIPIIQWKTHPVINRAMAFYARWCDDLIFTAARASFPMDLPQVRVVGHGIDTELFRGEERPLLGDLIAIGRIAPRKGIERLVEAVAHANRSHRTGYRLNIYGPTLPGDEAYAAAVEDLIDRLGARDWIGLHGPVPQERLPAILSGHRASLNFSETGIDKSVLEAMACGLPVISTNDSATEVMPPDLRPILVPDKHSTEQQAKAIHELLRRPEEDFAWLRQRMRDLVQRDHSVDLLFDRMLREIEALLRGRA